MANQMHAFKKMRPEPETFKAALPSWFIAAVNHVAKLWEERERKLQRLFGSHNSCVCEQWITIAKICKNLVRNKEKTFHEKLRMGHHP